MLYQLYHALQQLAKTDFDPKLLNTELTSADVVEVGLDAFHTKNQSKLTPGLWGLLAHAPARGCYCSSPPVPSRIGPQPLRAYNSLLPKGRATPYFPPIATIKMGRTSLCGSVQQQHTHRSQQLGARHFISNWEQVLLVFINLPIS